MSRSYQASDMVLRSHLSWLRGWLDGAKLPADVIARVDWALDAEQEMRDRLYDLLGERCTCPPWQAMSQDCLVHRRALLEAARQAIAEVIGESAAADVPEEIALTAMDLLRRRYWPEAGALLAPYRRPRSSSAFRSGLLAP